MVIIHQTWLLCLHTVAKFHFLYKKSILIVKVCLHFMMNFSCLFTFFGDFRLFVYVLWWISAVNLQFLFKISYLFIFHNFHQLFVFIFHSRSAVCLYLGWNICLLKSSVHLLFQLFIYFLSRLFIFQLFVFYFNYVFTFLAICLLFSFICFLLSFCWYVQLLVDF